MSQGLWFDAGYIQIKLIWLFNNGAVLRATTSKLNSFLYFRGRCRYCRDIRGLILQLRKLYNTY